MKKGIFLVLAVFVVLYACTQNQTSEEKKVDSTTAATQTQKNPYLKLQIYFFHATNRCATCNSIEANLKQLLENDFKAPVAQGLIEFKNICIDDASCKWAVEKYKVSGTALHLVKIGNGNESDNDFTEFAFTNSLQKKDVFIKTMQDTISYLIR